MDWVTNIIVKRIIFYVSILATIILGIVNIYNKIQSDSAQMDRDIKIAYLQHGIDSLKERFADCDSAKRGINLLLNKPLPKYPTQKILEEMPHLTSILNFNAKNPISTIEKGGVVSVTIKSKVLESNMIATIIKDQYYALKRTRDGFKLYIEGSSKDQVETNIYGDELSSSVYKLPQSLFKDRTDTIYFYYVVDYVNKNNIKQNPFISLYKIYNMGEVIEIETNKTIIESIENTINKRNKNPIK